MRKLKFDLQVDPTALLAANPEAFYSKAYLSEDTADNVGGRPRNPLTPVTPLFAPTQRPEEPITTGVKPGDGGGDEVLMMNQMQQQQSLSQTLAQMLPYDTNGEIAALYEQALSRGL